jgi:ATP-dependent DNA helicase RecQ
VRQKTGFGFGLNHIIEVLIGADTDAVRKWRHEEISAYGIGREMKRGEWQSIGRELVRLGYLRQSAEKFVTVELTDDGLAALKDRRAITLTKPVAIAEKKARTRRGEIACDEDLFERLRTLRRQLADERDVPAYIIFSDATLREMARSYPTNEAAFGRLPGVGAQKLKDFARAFVTEINAHLENHERQKFE